MERFSYILCRPQAGLNDSLVQIEKCCRYAEKNQRIVVVDTNYSQTRFFQDDFSNYFVSNHPHLILDYQSAPEDLNQLSTFPSSLAGRLDCYRATKKILDNEKGRFKIYVDESGIPIALNSNKSFSERVLVDHALGGGTISLSALSRLKLHPNLQNELSARVKAIPRPYTSIHIRNTDYSTNYKERITEIGAKHSSPIFVATDSEETLKECKNILGSERIFNFARHLSTDGKPIHRDQPKQIVTEVNADAILDLVILALARNYYYVALENNKNRVKASGYSMLANALFLHRPVLNQLINSNNRELLDLVWPATNQKTN